MVIYVKGSCSKRGDFAGTFVGAFTGVIKCVNDQLTKSLVVQRAWSFVIVLKEVRNDSKWL